MRNKILMGMGAVAGFLGFMIPVAHADLTPPVADPTVVAETTNAITGLSSSVLTNLGTLIPIAAGVLISVIVLYFVVRHFRGIAKV
jgi:hypothetical protein